MIASLFRPLKKLLKKAGLRQEPASSEAAYIPLNAQEKNSHALFRGYFDGVYVEDQTLVVSGWMISMNGPYSPVICSLNNNKQETATIIERPDVAQRLAQIPDSNRCGFRFEIPLSSEEMEQMLFISVQGLFEDEEAARMETWFHPRLYDMVPAPPAHLIGRVDELTDARFYLLKGIQNYGEFSDLIKKHGDPGSSARMLDWGCGSGRLSSMFLEFNPEMEVYGCDIDEEAVAWCQENLKKGHFTAIPPFPPTQYEDEMFDLIISFSVLTHLSRDVQNQWLAEMKRILKPGGLFIATVHGLTAARTILPPQEVQNMVQQGIHDQQRDPRLNGIAPEDYYRAVFQSREYITKEWSKYFDVEEYIEHGASNYHDIVVMRRRQD